jgi:hypothetical protein
VQNYTLSFAQIYTASDGVGIDDNIFLMNQRPVDPTNLGGPQTADYVGVCSPYDLATWSVNAPAPGQTLFRVLQVNRSFQNQNDADVEWTVVKEDVQLLINVLKANDNLNNVEVFTAS